MTVCRLERFLGVRLWKWIVRSLRNRVAYVCVFGNLRRFQTGLTAQAMTGSVFVEVPTTLMHYNDATTSAKKAFSRSAA